VGLQISTRISSGVTILDLRGRLTMDDGENVLLHSQLQELLTDGVRRFR